MKKQYTFDYEKYAAGDLSAPDRELVEAARESCGSAHAPYSGFRVGAAARLRSGRIIFGSNQESEVFPSTMCAERTLLYHWQCACGHPEPAETSRQGAPLSGETSGVFGVFDPIETLAIASVPAERECYPCGGCRQVLLDTERRQASPIRILMCSASTVSVVDSATKLLPFQFTL